MLAENITSLDKSQRRNALQRRNKVVDMYGYEFYRQGDSSTPAVFGISLSQDYIYLERFEFKLIISDFTTSMTSMSQVYLTTDGTNINPNPHDHVVNPGMTASGTTAKNYRIYIEGIDLTPYLMAQYGGNWINGNGIYPNNGLANYDVLKACGYMSESDRNKALASGYRHISITADAPFNVTLVNYLKYSHINR